MATFRTDYFPPSNRRRCVKGRSSYTDSSDLYLSAAVNQDQNSNGFSQNEDSYIDSVRSDDGEEEDITIDLSAFLNDNPLLAQAAFESASENNIASTESSSQFRVTDCKVDPSEIPKAAVTDPLLSVDVNGDTSVGSNIANENIVGPHAAATFIHNNTKENCLSPEKILINVTNNEPAQSVTLNGKKTVLSPTKKFSRALGLSNPLKKYKNFMKSKDLNKVNEKVFGKYPIVKCEKLDIENFVKNNKIKIRNWPLLQTESKKSNSVNKGTIKRKVNLNKGNLKPKFMKKPINFNKYLIASNKDLANQNISNILGDQPDVSKPIIIKTDSWKPGVTNVSSCVPSFFRPLTKTSLSASKNVVCDLLKLNDKTVGLNVISSPEKKCDIRAKTVATNINKLFNSPKNYPLIAPKPCLSSPNIHPITTTKPLIETLTTSVTDNFTVIEPYVDDPTSPQKPKPILTVPVEVVSSPEKQNPVINSSLISSVDITTNANNSEKLLKTEKSVFLNGGIKKIIVPTKTKTDVSVSKKEIVHRKINQDKLLKDVHRKINQEKLLKEVVPKVPVVLKVKDVSSEESANVLKAKNIVLDAMQNVFSSTQSKKIPKKSVRSVKKPTCDLTSGNSIIGSSAFSSILNDNILNGFSENDFEDVSLFDDDSFTDSTQEMSPPSKSLPDKVNVVTEDSGLTPKSIKKARERKKYKRKKSSANSPEINSTLSASECESGDKLEKDKRAVISHEDNKGNIKSSTIDISVHSKNFNEPVNKDFETKHVDSSLLFSNFESHISESQDSVSCNKLVSPKKVEQTEIPLSSFNEIVHNVNSPVKKCKENDNLVKQETSTRTLRDRKCSSTEVKNFNNSTKHNPHEKNSPEKNKNKSSINSKLKIQLKSPKNSSKNKLKKKSCKPEDIIQEINTITGGHSVPKRGLPKNKKSDSEKDIKSLDYSNINIQNDSESNSSNVSFSTQPSLCPLSEQKKTLKVCIKRSKRKTAMNCSKMSLNILTDVVDNANISNSVLESNLSLHSSFREAKDEKMGTLQKEENSAVNSSPIPDCNMENSNEKLHQKGQIPADAPDLMVNSSETPLLEDTSNNINSDINCTLADNILVIENQDNTKELPNDFVNNDDELNTEKHNFSSVHDLESSESLVKVDNIAILPPLEIGNSKDSTFSSEDNVKNSGNSESLIKENNSADIEVSSYLPNKDSKNTMLSSADEIKNSENDSDSCESLIKENNSTVIGVLPALVVENSKDIPLSIADSVELIDKTNSFSNINDSNDIRNENLHNIRDVTFDSTVNQTNENKFEETENTLEGNIAVNPEMAVENEVFEDFVHEETVIEEVVTMEICDDSEQISGNPDVSICVDDDEDKSNILPSIDSPEESASNPSSADIIIEEKDIDSSDVPSNDIQINKNKAEISDTCHQFTKDFKRSVSFPDNSSLTEKETLVVEESNNTSSDPTNDISENVSHELNEKCEDFSVNSLLLKSNNEDKITVSEEIVNLTDASSNNLTAENIDNRQFNTVSLNLSYSDTTSVKEILNTEIGSTNEGQKTGCQVNEASLNESCVSNETFEAKSDISIMNSDEVVSHSKTEKEILSIEKDSNKNPKSNSIENKKCPKIKLFKISDADSPDSLKSWFVSENSEKEVKSAISNESYETKSDNINSLNSDETPDLHESSVLDDNSSVNSENHKSNIEGDSYAGIRNAVLPEKTNSKSSCNFEAGSPSLSNLLSDKNVLTKIEEISSESHSVEKSNHIEEMSLPNDKVPSENINETASENLLPLDYEEQSKALLREKEDYDSPVIIKEEPMDIEENTESSSSYVLEERSIKTEPLPNKRKRGRPRKSIEYCNTSLDFGDDLVIPKLEKTTVPVIPEMKEEDVTPKREIKITPGAHSAGHKRKSNPVQASTPSSGRKKNYDPELVCLPFSMGWMREHVIRATGKDNKRQSDIYYFSPEGTKLRSMPDILTYLSKHPHIKLSAVNFTFAKELIYREPFEIERDAKQPSAKKICATPTAKKTPSKALISLADSPSDKSSSVESKKKLTLKRKRSSLNESDLLAEDKDTTFSSSNTLEKSKQLSLAELLTGNSNKTEDKPSRPSRRIVKKVPFDPSISSVESQPSKKAKSGTVVTRHSTGNLKKESIERASLIVKIPLKSSSSNITKENELQNSGSATELKKSEVSPIKSKKELSVNKPSNASAKSSMPGKSSESTSTEALLSRTNIKSPKIQNRLKVRLGGQRKTELITMHKPCTKYCNFSQVRIPSIQCTVCLCMFHPECIPFKPAGLTKYACVPCVVTNLGSSSDMSEDLFLADDFDIELLYPSMSLQIVEDPVFNATYNKFYSPVDHSFAHTIGINNARFQRPLQPCSAKNVAYYVNKNTLTPLNTSAPMQNPILYRPAGSFNVRNASYSVPTPIPIQPAPNVNMQNIRAANLRNSSGVQLKTVAPGSLPLLQNFSNAFFVQNQPFNSTSSSSSINFQNSFQQSTANNQVPLGTFTNADGSKVQRTLFVRKLPNNQQISGLISTGNVQNISDHTKNISVLQTMLQSHPEFSNKSIKLIKFNDYSTLKIAGDNIPTPISINVVSETNSSTSSKQTSNITPSESNCNKIKNDYSYDETMKKSKYSNVLETNTSAEVSSSPHKISNAHNFSEQLSASWNMNKFAQIYECLNFIFKFLNVSDLLRASLVCRSWNHLATQKLLWDHVSFSGITIKDWVRCCKTLQRHETKCIDFRGLYDQDSDDSWKAFLENILRLTDVEELIFEKVPPYVIKKIADSLPQLRKLTCFCMSSIFTEPEIWSTPCEFELASLRCLGRLEALKISSMGGIHLNDSQLSLLPYLPNLTHLVLSGFKFNSCINLECLSQMTQLITLELGDCKEIEPQIYGLLSQLTNLENLCLQNGGDINDKKLSESLLKINKLKTLELMNFQLSRFVSEALEKMDTLLHFSLWPDTRTKAEQVNFNSFKAATSCPNLKRLCWGILTDDDTVPNNTLELRDSDQNESVVKKMSFQELFQALVKHNPGVKVELKCLPRSIWSEFCSSRNFM